MLQEQLEQGSSPSLESFYSLDFVRKPVDIEQFCKDKFYMGEACEKLYPQWLEELKIVFAPNSQIYEWLLTGSTAGGKSFVASLAQVYKLYILSCTRSVNGYLSGGKLADNTPVYFGVYAYDKKTAEDGCFKYMKQFVDSSPYFVKHFPRNKKRNYELSFPRNLAVQIGSSEWAALGRSIAGFCQDEANFAQGDSAEHLYVAIRQRMLGRYLIGGKTNSLICLISSRRSNTDFLERHIEKVKGEKGVHISDFPIWRIRPTGTYSDKTFRVAVGNQFTPSRILADDELTPPDQQVITPPVELLQEFKRDVEKCLRDYGGVATYTISNYLSDRSKLLKCVNNKIPYPFTMQTIELDYRKSTPIASWFQLDKVLNVFDSRYRPKLNPNAGRYLHVDLALNGDACGISCVHQSGWVKTDYPIKDELKYRAQAAKITVDFTLQIKAAKGGEIDITAVREFLLFLRKCGYPIAKVTFDGYQSASSRQDLVKAGIESEVVSVDRTTDGYDYLWALLMDERLEYPEHKVLLEEIAHLRRIYMPNTGKPKIEHPEHIGKDCADSLAGAIYSCLEAVNTEAAPPPIRSTDWVLERTPRHAISSDGIVTGVVKDAGR